MATIPQHVPSREQMSADINLFNFIQAGALLTQAQRNEALNALGRLTALMNYIDTKSAPTPVESAGTSDAG